jgi:hypothetical protein
LEGKIVKKKAIAVSKKLSLDKGYFTNIILLQASFSYDWISLIADIGGWTGTLIGYRYKINNCSISRG